MQKLTTKWLDEICAVFEDSWEKHETGFQTKYASFTAQRSLPEEQSKALFLALAEIELERDWLWWRNWLKIEATNRCPTKLLEAFARIARVEQFINDAKEVNVSPDELDALSDVEYRARTAWGDAPHPRLFKTNRELFGLEGRKKTAFLGYHKGVASREFPLHGLTEFGRQRSHEPEAIASIHDSSTNRIVFAAHEDDRFSRRHFGVQILSPEYAIVTNLSKGLPLFWQSGLQQLPQQSIIALFPIYLQLPDLFIELS